MENITIQQLVEISAATLPFELTIKQRLLLNALAAYALDHGPRDVFILNGYAGTGKTSVVGALIKGLKQINKKTVVLAPTGRAAKVAAGYAGSQAFTIHKRIYRGNSLDPSNKMFFLAENKDRDTIFIIDEASMIPDNPGQVNSLLQHLIKHIYSAPDCGLIILGDIAQLPPVGSLESPAMIPDRISQLGLNPIQFHLDEPLRQTSTSGILLNATFIRKSLFSNRPLKKFGLVKKSFPDVTIVPGTELADYLSDSWAEVGKEETLIITRSNKRAIQYNAAIRNNLLYAESPLENGDRLIITKNDYYWSKNNKLATFIANGESGEVVWIGQPEKKYGLWFVDVELKIGEEEETIGAKIMLRSLLSESPSVKKEDMEKLYNRVLAEYEGELSHKIKGALEDPYYNALQVKYSYCVTCHKAQGGQWKHVYVDMAGLAVEEDNLEDFYRWLYTAVTRATEHIFFIEPNLKVV